MRHKSILLAGFIGGDCRFPLHLSVCLSVCLSHFRILRFWCLSSAYCYNAIVTFGKTMRTLQCCLPTQGLNGSGCVMSWLCYLCSLLCNYYRSQYIYFTYSKKKRNALNLIFMNWCAFFSILKVNVCPLLLKNISYVNVKHRWKKLGPLHHPMLMNPHHLLCKNMSVEGPQDSWLPFLLEDHLWLLLRRTNHLTMPFQSLFLFKVLAMSYYV